MDPMYKLKVKPFCMLNQYVYDTIIKVNDTF